MTRSMFTKMAHTAIIAGCLATGAWACGDDDGGSNGGSGGSGGSTAGSGGSTAGSGGSTAGSGGSTAGSGGGDAVMCGGATCMPVANPAGDPFPPCCDEDNGDICGATVSEAGDCVGVGQEGELDPSCPSAMSVIMTEVPGCCRPDGTCGLRSGALMGCVERTQYPPAFLAEGTPELQAQSCGDADAGM
jgi:hypothetical protein